MRPTVILLLLLSACARTPATVHAEFDHWVETDGTTHWQLTLTPDAWRQVGRGEPLDARHQNMSPDTLKTPVETDRRQPGARAPVPGRMDDGGCAPLR